MRHTFVAAAVAGCLLAASPLSGADEAPVGFVKTVIGDGLVVTGGKAEKAAVGTPVYQGSVLKTGPQSALGVTFRDETVMTCGPASELVVENYRYAPARGDIGLVGRLVRGSMLYLSGVIAKLQPESVKVVTPTATIGIRGTRFLVRADEE